MNKVVKSEIRKADVLYTIESGGGTLTYSIPRTFTAEQADLTLAAYLRDLDTPKEEAPTSVDDWATDVEELSSDVLQGRVDTIEEDREKVRQEEAERAEAQVPVLEVSKPDSDRQEQMLNIAQRLEEKLAEEESEDSKE